MDAQKILLQDQPMIVLYSQSQIAAARKNVQNWPNNYNGWFGGQGHLQDLDLEVAPSLPTRRA